MSISKSPETLGYSLKNRAIELYSFGNGPIPVLILGGIHGDEIEGFTVAERFLGLLQAGTYTPPDALTLHICPRANPDGCAENRRTNHHNVDLNRNLPTGNWSGDFVNVRYYPGPSAGSEPENKVLMKLLEDLKPRLILSLHSYEKPMVNFDGAHSKPVAEVMSAKCGLVAKGDIGYPTTGSLGNYAGIERKIPTITLEILKGQDLEEVWEQHQPGLVAALNWASTLK